MDSSNNKKQEELSAMAREAFSANGFKCRALVWTDDGQLVVFTEEKNEDTPRWHVQHGANSFWVRRPDCVFCYVNSLLKSSTKRLGFW